MTTDPQIVRVSPSQIKKWRGCKRQWGFRYIDGIEEPTSPKQAFGTAVHAALEAFFKSGVPLPSTPEGLTAAQVIRQGWTPHLALRPRTERPFAFAHGLAPGVHFAGFVDLSWVEDGIPHVVDFKSSSSLDYALDETALSADPQALIYAVWAMAEFEAPLVRCRWLYATATNPKTGPRRPAGARRVEIEVRADGDPSAWRAVCADAVEIRRARLEIKSALELPPSLDQCSAYGGCPHRARCPIPAGVSAAHKIGSASCEPSPERSVSMSRSLSKLIAAEAAAKTGAPLPPPTAAVEAKLPAAALPEPTPAQGRLLDKLRAENSAKGVNPAPREITPAPLSSVEHVAATVLPDGSEVPAPAPALAGEECPICHKTFARIATHHARGPCADELARRRDVAGIGPSAGEQRAREIIAAAPAPAAAEMKACAKCEAPVEAPQLVGPERCEGCADPAPPSRPIEVLLVDCLPLGAAGLDLAELLREPSERVCAEAQVSHLGEIPYRAGYERAAAYLLAHLDARPEPVHYLLVDSTSPLARYALDGLKARADLVIVGVAR